MFRLRANTPVHVLQHAHMLGWPLELPINHAKMVGDADDSHGPQTVVPLTSPAFTGSLDLRILGGVGDTARHPLDLPNGPRF